MNSIKFHQRFVSDDECYKYFAKSTYASVGGDSGGLILTQTDGRIMGIHQSCGNGTGNYCKVGNINYMSGITLATW